MWLIGDGGGAGRCGKEKTVKGHSRKWMGGDRYRALLYGGLWTCGASRHGVRQSRDGWINNYSIATFRENKRLCCVERLAPVSHRQGRSPSCATPQQADLAGAHAIDLPMPLVKLTSRLLYVAQASRRALVFIGMKRLAVLLRRQALRKSFELAFASTSAIIAPSFVEYKHEHDSP